MPNERRDLAIVCLVAMLMVGMTVRVWAGLEEGEPVTVLTPSPTPELAEPAPLATLEPIGPSLSRSWPPAILQWSEPILAASVAHGLDPDLIAAVIMMESGGNPEAHGRSGEFGLMQIMPYHSCVSWGPAQNIDCGAQILARNIERAGGDVRAGLAAYNAGEAGRDRDGKGWGYADRVLTLYNNNE